MKLCRITAPHFVAGAVFTRKVLHRWDDSPPRWTRKTGWVCVDAAPIIRYLIGEPAEECRSILKKKGYKWEWVDGTLWQDPPDQLDLDLP